MAFVNKGLLMEYPFPNVVLTLQMAATAAIIVTGQRLRWFKVSLVCSLGHSLSLTQCSRSFFRLNTELRTFLPVRIVVRLDVLPTALQKIGGV